MTTKKLFTSLVSALCVGGARKTSDTELALIDIFCMKIVLAYDNFEAAEQSKLDQGVEIALLTKLTAHASYLSVSHAMDRGRLSRSIALREQTYLCRQGLLRSPIATWRSRRRGRGALPSGMNRRRR